MVLRYSRLSAVISPCSPPARCSSFSGNPGAVQSTISGEVHSQISEARDSDAKRLYQASGFEADATNNNTPGTSHRGRTGFLERETGFEPATLSLGM